MEPTVSTELYSLYFGDSCKNLLDLPAGSVHFPLGTIGAILTDPPYGMGIGKMGFANNRTSILATSNDYSGMAQWDDERLSKKQIKNLIKLAPTAIVFGGNFYADYLPPSRCWYVWDKKDGGKYSSDYADCEMIWTNIDAPARIIRHTWHGMIQQDMARKEERFHPTQKPVAVVRRLILDLTKPGDLVIDPFMGSGTTCIAALQTGRRFVGFDNNEYYFSIAQQRIADELNAIDGVPRRLVGSADDWSNSPLFTG